MDVGRGQRDRRRFGRHRSVLRALRHRPGRLGELRGRRGAACRADVVRGFVLATTRADINGIVRKHLGARKISFASMDGAVSATGMEYGGITPIGLPSEWPVLIDLNVVEQERVIIGSGIRGSKLLAATAVLASLPNAEVLDITK
jgi:prolyl-tRNA editing enzyme YbaK/EbsC (Cys-tRNA(Pro) deacylase)